MSSTDDVPMADTVILATTTADDDKDDTSLSLLASHARQHLAAVATTALVQDAAPTDTQRHNQHLLVLHERAARLLEARCDEAAAAVLAAEEETSYLLHEIAELRTIADKIVPEMNREMEEENGMLMAALEEATKEIESKMVKIAQLKDLEKGVLDINTLELAPAGGGCKLGDHAVMLQENHKQEMEAIQSKLIQLEEQLEQREVLLLMTRQLNMKLEAGEKLTEEDHRHLYAVMIYLDEELKRFKDSLLDLYKREEMISEELQENRQELIQGMENMLISGRVTVGIKRMGKLDKRPFHNACKWKFRDSDPEGKAASLVSSWQEEIQKPSWYPFMTIEVHGEDKEVVNEHDPKLRQLRLECGDSVYCTVKDALREINEYSPHGRHIVNEIWNFPEGRKATMTEAITYILEQLTVADPGQGEC
ncbi:unnamed protein product [Alopecurus aequalis]